MTKISIVQQGKIYELLVTESYESLAGLLTRTPGWYAEVTDAGTGNRVLINRKAITMIEDVKEPLQK